MSNWLAHLRNFKYWRFVLGSVLLSELLTLTFNTIMSLLWWGRVSWELLAIGAIDAFAVALIVAPLIIYLLNKSADLSEVNQALQRQMLERRRTEEVLKESEERYRMLFERSGDSIFVIEAEGPEAGRILEVNETAARSHGFTRQEMLAMKVTDLDTPESAEQAPGRIRRLLAGEYLNFEVTHFRKDGSVVPLEVSAGLFEAGGRRRIVAFDRDISLRKRAEEALRHSEERYRALVEKLPYGLFIFEAASGRFLFVNQYGCDLFGFTPEQSTSLSIWDITDPADHPLMRERVGARLRGGEVAPSVVYTGLRRDNTRFRFEVNASLDTHEGRPVLMGFLRDVTEVEILQRQLQQAQKMEAVGTMAGGVAHEFNNILMAIRGYTQLLGIQADLSDSAGGYLKKIEGITARAAELTHNMLSFARKDSGERVPMSVAAVVKGMQTLLRRTLPRNIDLRVEVAPGLPLAQANPNQIEQVLLNLAFNARDAMPEGGVLSLRAGLAENGPEFARTHAWAQRERYVRIEVRDDGQGMPEEVQQHIFEPFYTTKEPGKGTGLGLSVVYSIVQSHDGGLEVESRPGWGTSLAVYLPLADEAGDGKARPADEELPPQGQGQRLLVVDDEISLREISSQALKSFGYRVRLAGDGMEALEAYRLARDMGSPFDLVILDLAMPVMGGNECLGRIQEMDPGAKVIIATGQADDDPEVGALAGRVAGLLRKPFNLVALIRQVGWVLAPPEPAAGLDDGLGLAAGLGPEASQAGFRPAAPAGRQG